MHGSVLQNKKYIKFAEENTVEVMALGRLDEAIEKDDRRTEKYKAKDKDGNEVEYLVEFPGLTVAMINSLKSSKAGSYNNTGKIPYTAIVDPHTLEEMNNLRGGYGAKTLMGAVTEARKTLEQAHGKSVSRKVLAKLDKAEQGIRKDVEKGKYSSALSAAGKLESSLAKQPDAVKARAAKVTESVLAAIGKRLDELEAAIGRGELKEAGRELSGLARALKGTALEERANALLEQTKAAE